MGEVIEMAAPAGSGTPGQTEAPAKPLTAIQLIEKEINNFIQQRESAIANLRMIEGAIQGAQHLIGKLRGEAAKAAAAAGAVEGAADAASTVLAETAVLVDEPK